MSCVQGPRWAFCHIPRTGGTSISEAMGGKVVGQHIPISKMRERGVVGQIFSVVRNPWDRMVSVWAKRRLANGESFEETLRGVRDGIMGQPAEHWLDEKCLVLRYEDLPEALYNIHDALCKPLGWTNKTLRDRDYTVYYTEMWMREYVYSLYRNEIERYDYSFQGESA